MVVKSENLDQYYGIDIELWSVVEFVWSVELTLSIEVEYAKSKISIGGV